MKTLEETGSDKPARFLVLLPHRDSLKSIEDLRKKLFAMRFYGAYSFPAAAPLALLSRPFDQDELRNLAHETRDATVAKDGKISSGINDLLSWPRAGLPEQAKPAECFEEIEFFGPVLDLPPLDNFASLNNSKVLHIFPKALLCASVLAGNSGRNVPAPSLMPLSFRPAVISNLAIRPLKNGASPYSFEWRLGPGCWLPAFTRSGPPAALH